ncbi:helix-turn-helix domain-containing protein [Streptomyces sp. NPDC056411]|uniref:telomere-associated protein Tap n=1 Tax=Streptomyces sp. NPDC056411 TaxID=3345813 RepID=UPI0035E0DF99
MSHDEMALFSAVDALLDQVAQDPLPAPAERKRLREAAGLSQEQVAKALQARREAVGNWEAGRTEPRPPKRAAYARLLEGLAARFSAPGASTSDPAAGEAAAPGTAVGDAATPGPLAGSTNASDTNASDTNSSDTTVGDAAAPSAPVPGAAARGGEAPSALPAPSTPPAAVTTPPRAPEPAADPAPAPASGTAPAPGPDIAPAAPTAPAPAPKRTAPRRPAVRKTPPGKPAGAATTTGDRRPDQRPDPRFANGPLGVLDGDGSLYCVGGLVLNCPATTLPALVKWTLAESRLGAPRLHRSGKDSDPLIVLTTEAAERLGLPTELADRRGLRLPDDHKVVKQLTRAKWQLTRRGFGPWARIYRPAEGGTRQCVQLAVLPWGALDSRSWGGTGQLPAADVAAVLGTYATRVLTPRGSTAVCGLELMSALRPPTRAVKDESTGSWVSGPMPGSLTRPVDPAPPEAPAEHPVVTARYPRFHERTPDEVLDEEAYDWFRPLTDEECARGYTHAVGIDVNMAFAAAANRLNVGLGPATHLTNPAFDPKLPGSWLADLSHLDLDPRLPSPFTPTGTRPEGPAWYSTSTLAYAVELGHPVAPAEAYVRYEHGAYLDPWYTRLRDAYLATMADLGVETGLSEQDFLAAMAGHKEADPGRSAVLSAIKSTVKGGIGKLRERPQSAKHAYGERWPALERPTWSPHIRAELIGKARTNMHRKMAKLAAVGRYPVAVLSDCAVYLAHGPGPLDFLPRTPEGAPLPGGFRLGVSPGMVKHEGTQDFLWVAAMIEDEALNPARHIKGTDAAADGE